MDGAGDGALVAETERRDWLGAFFRGSAATLRRAVRDGSLPVRLTDAYVRQYGAEPDAEERRFWLDDLPVLAELLHDAELGPVEVIVRPMLPGTTHRLQVLLAGERPCDTEPACVVVELRDWVTAESESVGRGLCLPDGRPATDRAERPRAVLHPLTRPAQYQRRLWRPHLDTESPDGVAFLHRARARDVAGLARYPAEEDGGRLRRARSPQLFTEDRRAELMRFLRTRLAPVPGAGAADELLAGLLQAESVEPVEPPVKSPTAATTPVLLGQQAVACLSVLGAVAAGRTPQVLVVTGGPGSGKSTVALELLRRLRGDRVEVRFASRQYPAPAGFREIADRYGFNGPEVFTTFDSIAGPGPAEVGSCKVLICDTTEGAALPWVDRTRRPAWGTEQVRRILGVAPVVVFLLDERSVLGGWEDSPVRLIERAARRAGRDVSRFELPDTFRYGGSLAYELWVPRLLGLRGDGPASWRADREFRVLVAEEPYGMERFLDRVGRGSPAVRVMAGLCQPLDHPGRTPAPGVRIGEWSRPWRLTEEIRPVAQAVDTVYGVQGAEFDWTGVVLGPDLVWRDDRWRTVREASHDPVIRNRSLPETDADRLIRNAYHVLLTRARRGTVLYSTDRETRELLRRLVPDHV